MALGYFIKKFFTSKKGKLHVLREFLAFLYVVYFKRTPRRIYQYDYDDTEDLHKVALKIPPQEYKMEYPKKNLDFSESSDDIQFYGVNSSNDSCFVKISKTSEDSARVWLTLRLFQGTSYTPPLQKEWKIPRTGDDCFAAGGLRIRCLSPMRRWRISFNGILTETCGDRKENVHVKFSFIWLAGSEIHDFSTDINPKILANFLAKQTWPLNSIPNLKEVLKYFDSYEQVGIMKGTISVRSEDEKEVYLWGGRKRSIEISDSNSPIESVDFFGYLQDGESFHVGRVKFPHLNSELKYGYLVHSNGLYFDFEDCKMSLPNSDQEKGVTTIQTADLVFQEGKSTRKIHFGLPTKIFEIEDPKNPKNVTLVHCSPILFAEEKGYGIVTSVQRTSKPATKDKNADLVTNSEPALKDELVVPINKLRSKDCDIAGGKGSSLGQLAAIGQKDTSFTVPKGLVLTTTAYKEFLKSSKISRKNITLLEDVASGKNIGVLEDVCKNVVNSICSEELPEEIQSELKAMLEKTFPKALNTLKFAVRSSATGEDSEELSAAGQMDTLLGIQGFQEITKAAVKCWASQFSYTAIQYKRQYGQILNSPMAVVVQEMVPADSAGVIFTCDPLTGNPEIITITANYGIGESVVSATADPDTITFKRYLVGKIKLDDVQLGQKKVKIMMSESASGVEERQVDSAEAQHCCLSQDIAKDLAKLAIKIEDAYACPTDIEWAVHKDKMYLLQARPVTTFDKETEFETIHENDTFMQTEKEYSTIANVGEVMPGAISHFGWSFLYKLWNITFGRYTMKKNPNCKFTTAFTHRMWVLEAQHMHMNMLEAVLRFQTEKSSFVSNANVISLFGHLIEDDEMYKMAAKRTSNYPDIWRSSALVQIYYIITDMLMVGNRLRKTIPKFKNYSIQLEHCQDSLEMLDEIYRKVNTYIVQGQIVHLDATLSSSFWNIMLLAILQSASGGWNTDVFSDFSMLLSSIKNVESADVPKAMQKLSQSISKCVNPSEFNAMKPEDALKWLKESEVSDEFRNFFEIHGHRCVKEFDCRSKPWGLNPLPLVKILQEMVTHAPAVENNNKQSQDLLVPLSFMQKLMLKFFIPFARRGVRQREMSKSLIIKSVHVARVAYLKLARQIVEEGRLPDEDLMFFLTLDELQQLLETRSPRLVQKAIRRRTVHPKLEEYMYKEISRGYPKPINTKEIEDYVYDATLCMKGIPVSRGVVKAPVRVATNLEEARNIKQGEILIAYSTDIGWSPYFPLLAGVCTELGGLISHGAVVAREYGLPCVVSVHNATRKFKTGDVVVLDGNKGTLQLIT